MRNTPPFLPTLPTAAQTLNPHPAMKNPRPITVEASHASLSGVCLYAVDKHKELQSIAEALLAEIPKDSPFHWKAETLLMHIRIHNNVFAKHFAEQGLHTC